VGPEPACYDVAAIPLLADDLAPITDELSPVTVEDVLKTMSEFGMASRDLVAWEFALDGGDLAEVWDQAVGEGLIRPVPDRDNTGEQMYALATPGHSPVRASAHRRR
jgi:hypothetical protein